MNLKEMRSKSIDELQTWSLGLLKRLFNLNMQKASGQLVQSHLLGKLKRDVARTKTILNEKTSIKHVRN